MQKDEREPGERMARPSEVSGADLLVESLAANGITTLFGVPGDTGVALYDALSRQQGRLRHVLARDERHAAAMADAYARSANRVGAVEVSSGGGSTYVIGGLGEAFAASVPVLVISTDVHTGSRGSGALTEIDQVALFSAVTKWRQVVPDAAAMPQAVAAALTEATTGRPAPVALIIPEDVLDQRVPAGDRARAADRTRLPLHRPSAGEDLVHEVARLLRAARRPAVLAGSGVHVSGAWAELAELASGCGLPVATTIHGKGAIAETSPWSLGVAGANGGRPQVNDYLRQADFVLMVGTRANATDTNSRDCVRAGVPTASVDIDAERCGRNYPDGIRLVGDAGTVLGQLLRACPDGIPQHREGLQEHVRQLREAARRPAPSQAERSARPDRLSPAQIVQVTREVLDGECSVVADPGTPTPNVASYWQTTRAGRSVVIPRGHGPMGYAIPAAIGVALARPGSPVVSFTADGSFAMACGELETAARLALPIIYVQFTNNSLGWIKMLQHLYFDRRYFGVEPGPIDAVAVAKAAGIPGLRVTSLEEYADVLRKARASGGPVYIDATVLALEEETPPVAPWQAALAGRAVRPVY
jgi:acetolactate synthase-1/2/3 large subunit